jgi:hypothetical protein
VTSWETTQQALFRFHRLEHWNLLDCAMSNLLFARMYVSLDWFWFRFFMPFLLCIVMLSFFHSVLSYYLFSTSFLIYILCVLIFVGSLAILFILLLQVRLFQFHFFDQFENGFSFLDSSQVTTHWNTSLAALFDFSFRFLRFPFLKFCQAIVSKNVCMHG